MNFFRPYADFGLGGVIVVPNQNCVLEAANKLVYNDAPWVDANDPRFAKTQSELSFVHPKISNKVAGKVGVRSLRYVSS